MKNSLYVRYTDSTNALLWKMSKEEDLNEGFVVHTDFQRKGKGTGTNNWEAERGKNLLLSMLLYPQNIPLDELFLLSQLVSVSIKKTLEDYADGFTVKWPNDIYWNDKKIAGILIENSIQGNKAKAVVIGIGLNVNQNEFMSDAPNPISLKQITGTTINRRILFSKIKKSVLSLYETLDKEYIRSEYLSALYKKEGYHAFETAGGKRFKAKIDGIKPDGKLELETLKGTKKGYYYKEVSYR